MGNRNRPPRLTHPLMVAASALNRATDPGSPSRLTVIRLLGDALHALQESQVKLSAINARSDIQLSQSSSNGQSFSRLQVEIDNQFRHAHNEGSRALFAVTVTALIKLPSRGGPLRRRAVDLVKLAAPAAGPSCVMASVDRVRSHISAIKRHSWSESDPSDFEIAASILTLADVSTCAISSRDIARESVHFLLSQRVRQKCRRGDLAYALAVILGSFPKHAPPDDRLIDLVLQFGLAQTALKQGFGMFGGALLVAIVSPFVVSRGPAAGDEIAVACARALKIAPTPTERGMWALALARAVVTARRSSTYQLRRYGTSELGSKFPKGLGSLPRESSSDNDSLQWISGEIFEEALVQVATMTGLEQGSIDSSIATAAVLRMWLSALPGSLDTIVPRSLLRLVSKVNSVSALSVIVDAIWLGITKHLRPSQSATVFGSMMPLIADSGLSFPAALSVCASLVRKFGRQAMKESGLSTDYNTNTTLFIKRVHDALESVVCVVRLSGTDALFAILQALPRTCTQFLTAVLQNLRIADLTTATKPSRMSAIGPSYYEKEISPLLGNGSALSLLVEKLGSSVSNVPIALSRQCIVDVFALLRPHKASDTLSLQSSVVACVRRRIAWGIIAGFARGKRKEIFENDSLNHLLNFWTEELKYGGNKLSKGPNGSLPLQANLTSLQDNPDILLSTALDDALARSSARAAALLALTYALQNVSSPQLEQSARALTGACAARTVALLSSINSSPASSNSSSAGVFMGFATEHSLLVESTHNKRRGIVRLIKALANESLQMIKVVGQVPPTGDASELCFFVAMALAEEAQRALGESDSDHVVNGHLTHGVGSSLHSRYNGIMSNQLESLLLFDRLDTKPPCSEQFKLLQREKGLSSNDIDALCGYDMDISWLFSKEGLQAPIAERALIYSGRAIAAVVSEDLSAHGSLIESLPAGKLTASLCAVISLEMTKRLSRTDLAEINRALAVLQILVKRSLGITGGVLRSIMSQKKVGRLYTPSTVGDGPGWRGHDTPGVSFLEVTMLEGSSELSKIFSNESVLSRLPFHNYHSRALGTMFATRSLACEAHRELSITGGPTLWIGLTRKIIETVRASIDASTPSEFISVSNAIATLGALLEVVPEPASGVGKQGSTFIDKNKAEQSVAVNDLCRQAIEAIAEVIERGKIQVQAVSALALCNRSYLVASSSERLIGALVRAWANDKGEPCLFGQLGRYSEETDTWVLCFDRAWSDMGVLESEGSSRFFHQDSCGLGSVSDALMSGATGVLSACRLYWWPLGESALSSVRELAIDLVQWQGNCSHQARTAGLYGIISIWSGKIDIAQAEQAAEIIDIDVEGEERSKESVLPAEFFSLKDTSRGSYHVGPFLDEVIYESLAPDENAISSFELRAAATCAVSEIIRGLGVEKTCAHLPRLPETLLAAIEGKTFGAQGVVDTLVNEDAEKRPRYWFGLCRAVALGGERLNFGKKGTVWDVSYRTKAYSARVAVDAIDRSLAKCSCNLGEKTHLAGLKHSCAYGFLRKIFDFAKQISSAASFDFESCGQGCRVLQRIASRVGSCGGVKSSEDYILDDYFEMWDPSVAMMHTLLVDRVPHGVVNSAATAMSELLVSAIKLDGNCRKASQRCAETVASYLQALVESDLRQRLKYSDQGEDVGTHAVLSLIGRCACIISHLKARHKRNGQLSHGMLPGERTAKSMFFALCGDYIATRCKDGLIWLTQYGGSLTPVHIDGVELCKAMSLHIASIVPGAISCIGGIKVSEAVNSAVVSWENEESVGLTLAKKNTSEDIALATLVLLLTHAYPDKLSISKRLSFCGQVQESLHHIFRIEMNTRMHALRDEIILAIALFNKTESLKFAERMLNQDEVYGKAGSFIVNITLSVLLATLQEELGAFQECETKSVCRGLRALSHSISKGHLQGEEIDFYALKILDVLFQMAGRDSNVTATVLCETEAQIALCETMSTCTEALRNRADVLSACETKIWTIYEHGIEHNNSSMMKISAALAATISNRDGEIVSELLFDMIIFEQSGQNLLEVAMDCHNVEECVINYINIMSQARIDDTIQLLTSLGTAAASLCSNSVPPAFRISVAAILVEGEFANVINKMGMVLYSFFLSRLVQTLPMEIQPRGSDLSSQSWESAKYFLELVEEESDISSSFVSSLCKSDRQQAQLFLSKWAIDFE